MGNIFDEGSKAMHILLGVLSTISLIVFILWRVSGTLNALSETGSNLNQLAGKLSRFLKRGKASRAPLSDIEDPREAALVLMVAVMKDRGNLTSEQIEELVNLAETRLNFSNAEEMVTLARWHVKDFAESGAVLYRLAKPLARQCDGAQRADIIDLVTMAANSGRGEMTRLQAHTIRELRYKFGDVTQQTLQAAE